MLRQAQHERIKNSNDWNETSQNSYINYFSPVRADPSASSGVNARLPSEAFGEGRVEAYEPL